jgi:hypothetical protein
MDMRITHVIVATTTSTTPLPDPHLLKRWAPTCLWPAHLPTVLNEQARR